MQAGKVVLNIDLTPTQSSLKALQKSFNKIGESFFYPIKKMEKLMKSNAMAGWGSKAASSLISVASDIMKQPLNTLADVLNTQKEMMNKGANLGISTQKQANLDKYLADMGLGSEIGSSIQSSFASALEGGKLASLQASGMVTNKGDSADKLKSFLQFLSSQSKESQAIISKQFLGTQNANMLSQSREFLDNKKGDSFSGRVNRGIGNSTKDGRSALFGAQLIDAQREAQLNSMKVGKTENIEKMSMENFKIDTTKEATALKNTTIEKIRSLDVGVQALAKGQTIISDNINRVINVLEAIYGRIIKIVDWFKNFSISKYIRGKL